MSLARRIWWPTSRPCGTQEARPPRPSATCWLPVNLITTAEGMPIIWGLANPKIGEREVTLALLEHDHHLIASGQVNVAGKGFAGRDFEQFVATDLGSHLIRPDRVDEPTRVGKPARVRQWIETIIDTLRGQLTLEDHGARTLAGRPRPLRSSPARPIWHNWATNGPDQTIPHRLRPLTINRTHSARRCVLRQGPG